MLFRCFVILFSGETTCHIIHTGAPRWRVLPSNKGQQKLRYFYYPNQRRCEVVLVRLEIGSCHLVPLGSAMTTMMTIIDDAFPRNDYPV